MKFIVKPGCSFFVDFKRYNEGDTVELTKSGVKPYKNYVDIDLNEVEDDEEPEVTETKDVSHETSAETPEKSSETAEPEAVEEDAPKPKPTRRRRS